MTERLQGWGQLLGTGQSSTGRGCCPSPGMITSKLLHPLEGWLLAVLPELLLFSPPNTPHLCFSNANGEEDGGGSSFLQETQLL